MLVLCIGICMCVLCIKIDENCVSAHIAIACVFLCYIYTASKTTEFRFMFANTLTICLSHSVRDFVVFILYTLCHMIKTHKHCYNQFFFYDFGLSQIFMFLFNNPIRLVRSSYSYTSERFASYACEWLLVLLLLATNTFCVIVFLLF